MIHKSAFILLEHCLTNPKIKMSKNVMNTKVSTNDQNVNRNDQKKYKNAVEMYEKFITMFFLFFIINITKVYLHHVK